MFLTAVFFEQRTAEIVAGLFLGAVAFALLFFMAAFPPSSGILAQRRTTVAVSCVGNCVAASVLVALPSRGLLVASVLAATLLVQLATSTKDAA